MSSDQPVEIAVPDAVTELRLLDRVDYQDAFRVDTALQRAPEQWMRAIIEGAPRWFTLPWLHVLGRGLLRADIGPMDAHDHVLGWKVLTARPDAFAVGLDSPNGLLARLITVAPAGQAIFATQIRLDATRVRMLWPAIRRGHRYFAPYLLQRAARLPTAATNSPN
ncbi:MAG TPA: hypothetical protein VFA96_04540 [Nocardioides sp.]|jgi:hypothetical protein|nr:hypothetical protein [Nocardioides sp.]